MLLEPTLAPLKVRKLGWFSALKASSRKLIFTLSLMGKFFEIAPSMSQNAGPWKVFRPIPVDPADASWNPAVLVKKTGPTGPGTKASPGALAPVSATREFAPNWYVLAPLVTENG